MSVHPQRMPTTPEGKVWDKLGDLHRRVLSLERGETGGVQRGYAQNIAGASGITAIRATPVDLGCAITVNVPSTSYRVLVWCSANIQPTNTTTGVNLQLLDTVDFGSAGLTIATVIGTASSIPVSTSTPNQTPGTGTIYGWDAVISPYGMLSGTVVPTPGNHTFSMGGSRDSGAGSGSITAVRLWVAVV